MGKADHQAERGAGNVREGNRFILLEDYRRKGYFNTVNFDNVTYVTEFNSTPDMLVIHFVDGKELTVKDTDNGITDYLRGNL